MRKIIEEARELEVRGEYDVVVIGGGAAGISAAMAAQRDGARTLLIERYGFLGGMSTAGLVGSFCGFYTTGPEKRRIVGGIGENLLNRLRRRGAVTEKMVAPIDNRLASHRFNPEVFKSVAEEAVVEHGADLLFHTLFTGVLQDATGRRLLGVTVENKSGRSAYLSGVIVDATGDADVAYRAGVPCEVGNGKGVSQSLTTMFRLANVDMDKLRALKFQDLREKLAEAREQGFRFMRVDSILGPTSPKGLVTANMTGIPHLNALDAEQLTRAEIEGRRQVFEYVRFLRTRVVGFEDAEVVVIGTQVGIRETRRILGEHTLQENEVLEGQKFSDGIALGAWPVEFHDPGAGTIEWRYLDVPDDYYSIPMRCLIARGVDNLLVAGRCTSTTHVAQASSRVTAQALAMGEAAGILAAETARSCKAAREIAPDRIQEELERNGAILTL
jgi:hypothetical protein